MYWALIVLHVIVCTFLVLVVLLQAGKGGGVGIAFGGGGSQTVFGSSGAGNFLTKLTAICATIFFLNSLALAYLSSASDSNRLRALSEKQAPARRRNRRRRTRCWATSRRRARICRSRAPRPRRRHSAATRRPRRTSRRLGHPPAPATTPPAPAPAPATGTAGATAPHARSEPWADFRSPRCRDWETTSWSSTCARASPGRTCTPAPTDPAVAQALCDRHFGIGADGVLAILPGQQR